MCAILIGHLYLNGDITRIIGKLFVVNAVLYIIIIHMIMLCCCAGDLRHRCCPVNDFIACHGDHTVCFGRIPFRLDQICILICKGYIRILCQRIACQILAGDLNIGIFSFF